ncbi:MAG: rhodanese-like domain-containing protein, partial [Desulfuromonadales bacterium]|nr:rhodanese-like domain-containing protein [Desulfuromonadales bacterium]NIR34427.1 rhodanese-like domain-containing protein [Desulfuromonadales bacterium]NIS42969.1 rhodanese-like domain-containing protein [Desulfuromonadales bacterium]
LAENRNEYLVVDVRSDIEYGVVHINNAVNVPVAHGGFVAKLAKLRERHASQPIAFYCNGHTCAKSYKASVKAMDAGFKNVYCFDAGIYEWVRNHPEQATLMGETPAATEKLISKAAFN